MKTTIDNFAQVLEFNGWLAIPNGIGFYKPFGTTINMYGIKETKSFDQYRIYFPGSWRDYDTHLYLFEESYISNSKLEIKHKLSELNFDYFLQCLELKIGKLKELPEFDYLNFIIKHDLPCTLILNDNYFHFQNYIAQIKYKPTLKNAETILEIKKLLDALEGA